MNNQFDHHEPLCGSAMKRKSRKRHPQVRRPRNKITPNNASQVYKIDEIELSVAEESVLAKGLLFIPSPRNKIKPAEIDEFKRRLRLKEFFLHLPPSEFHPFKPKSSFDPGVSKNKELEKYLSEVERCLLIRYKEQIKVEPNFTKEEVSALKSLKRRKNEIVIRKADKGSTITVASMGRYVTDGELHLSDKKAYRTLDHDPTPHIANRAKLFLQQIHEVGYIDDYELKYMMPPDPCKTQHIYFPYKIHKNPVAVRPVVSGINGPTTKISNYLDYFFKQLVPKVPSYLQNSKDLVDRLRLMQIPPTLEQILLVSLDVKSMYTSIPQQEGIDALLSKSDVIGLPKHIIREMCNLVFKRNVFSFNGKIYEQTTGVAMGTPLAPTLAILYMADLENEFLHTQKFKPYFYVRYIDDIFIIWLHGREKLDLFFHAFNQFNPAIQFDMEVSDSDINFLDITIYKSENFNETRQLYTKTHFKETNTFQYIHFLSHHPLAVKKSVLYSEILRFKMQCTENKEFKNLTITFIKHFLQRGYPYHLIKSAISKVENVPLPDTSLRVKKEVIPLKIQYDTRITHIHQVIRDQQHMISNLPDLQFLNFDTKILVAFINKPNIKQIITSSSLQRDKVYNPVEGDTMNWNFAHMSERCNNTQCMVCPSLHIGNGFKCTSTKKRIPITHHISCTTRNIIYVLTCNECSKQYVGITTRTPRERMRRHRQEFRRIEGQRSYLYRHADDHSKFDFSIVLLEKCPSPTELKRRETYWIHRLSTTFPKGLNTLI